MEEPVSLTEEQVVSLNLRAISKDGGTHGVLDPGLLSSAVAMPQARFEGRYLHDSIAAMAAAYLYHICQTHAFHDGNKRTAVLAAVVFLDLNACDLEVDDDPFEELVVSVATRKTGKDRVTAFVEEHMVPRAG